MPQKHNCENCAWRAKYDARPQSIIGRLWRWHIRFCPGWKAYYNAQPDDVRRELASRYSLPKH